ncbi:SnoaL-like domain-containing protein [Xanthomonas campestris pv. nigromaculans]|nr:nuclear transport factor 2 family protein [Xanthomonas campestris pv. nigromaculans]CAH2709082.1 SnoaL-like domain-containing protein [Xanthomonas campestris pv. nigromaculans]
MKAFPKVGTGAGVDPADRISAIDFVNRVNWWFETWDVESIMDAFLPDAVTYHFQGTHSGIEQREHFLAHDYPYLIPGVSRHATNHIVDQDEDGVVVRYHNLLVRYASPEAAAALRAGQVMDSPDDLPAIWVYAPMMDRLRRTEDGWKIMERYLGGSTTNSRLDPSTKSASEIAPYLPKVEAN